MARLPGKVTVQLFGDLPDEDTDHVLVRSLREAETVDLVEQPLNAFDDRDRLDWADRLHIPAPQVTTQKPKTMAMVLGSG